MVPRTLVFSASDSVSGHCRPIPPPETPEHSQASLVQCLVGSLLLSPGSWVNILFVPSKSLFPQSVEVLYSNPTDVQSQIP